MAKRLKKTKQAVRPAAPPAVGVLGATALETELRRGLAAFERGDYAEAVQVWQRARRAGTFPSLDRALAEAHFRIALRSGQATSLPRQVQELREAAALVPDSATYQFRLGLALYRQGQLRRALVAVEEAHRLAPGDDRIRRSLALMLLADPTSVARVRDLLARAPPRDEAVARLRALAALEEKDPAGAVATLAPRKSPTVATSLARGLAYLAADQASAAQPALARVQRSRQPLSAEARQAAVLALVVACQRVGDLDGALGALRKQEVPGDASLRRAFADASRRLGVELVLDDRPADALFAWGQALKAQPDHEPTRRGLTHLREVLGTRAARQGDFTLAAQHWAAALADQPGNARLLRNLALAEERLERWPVASAHWEELVRQWKKELQGARRQDEAAAELRRRLSVAQRHLAETYRAAGDPRAAARALDRALNFDPSDVDLRLRAAELYLENEDYANAIDHLRRALAARPSDTRILLDLGSAHDLKGDDRQALGYLEQALALEPDSQAIKDSIASVHHGRGHRLEDTRQSERAAAEFERAAELTPGNPEHWQCLGRVQLKLGRSDAAGLSFARALALRPSDPKIRVAIGSLYLEHKDEQQAEQLFKQVLGIENSLIAHTMVGIAYVRYGDPAKAGPYFARVLKGKQPDLLVLIATTLQGAGRTAEAIPYLERAVSLAPRNILARFALATARRAIQDIPRAAAELAAAEELARAAGNRRMLDAIEYARELNELFAEGAPRPEGGPRPDEAPSRNEAGRER